MQKAMLAIAVLCCIARPVAAASRSHSTAAEAIILYKGGDRDLMVYFLGLGEGMAWRLIPLTQVASTPVPTNDLAATDGR